MSLKKWIPIHCWLIYFNDQIKWFLINNNTNSKTPDLVIDAVWYLYRLLPISMICKNCKLWIFWHDLVRYTSQGTGSVEPARISDCRPYENDRKTAPKNTNHRSGEEQPLYCTPSKDSEYIRRGPRPINPKIRHTNSCMSICFLILLYYFQSWKYVICYRMFTCKCQICLRLVTRTHKFQKYRT